MTRDVAQLETLLARSPEDWSVRITLIEERIRRDDKDAARKLVRDSPDESPLPYELQYRLHSLMKLGKEVLEPLPSVPEGSEILEKAAVPEPPKAKPELPKTELERKIKPVPAAKSDPVVETSSKKPNFDEVAPVKDAALKAKRNEIFGLKKAKTKPVIELKKNTDTAKKWDDYQGKLLLTDSEIPAPEKPMRRSFAAEKVSALSAAFIIHLVLAVAGAFVVFVQVRQPPPELIVSVIHEKEAELQTTHLNKTKKKNFSAAAAQALDLMSTVAPSTMKIPEMDNTAQTNLTALVSGIAPVGMGLSFTGAKDEVSDINFFGISGGGNRVIFVIDATKPMLVDEKGGMFAYDKVKNEIGAMLSELRRGTYFNILLYNGKQVVAFRESPVAGLPSNRRKAVEWLQPLNRDYENLGLRNGYREGVITMSPDEIKPIQTTDLAHYTKCIQKALEWQASAIFCISGGYSPIRQTPTLEMREEYAGKPGTAGIPGKVSPAEAKTWQAARKKTQQWLQKENTARREQGLPPKVVANFNQLIQQVTGASPPRANGGTPATGGMPRLPNYTPEEIEKQVKNLVAKYYDEADREKPSVHMVLFLGENEKIGPQEDHFKDLTRKNRGKLKILRGLVELQDVTSG